jgi:hypothetical protein
MENAVPTTDGDGAWADEQVALALFELWIAVRKAALPGQLVLETHTNDPSTRKESHV